MFYHCKNESRKLEVCGREYFRICIHILASMSQQIPALSKKLNLINFQDHNHFPGLSRSWKEPLQKIQDFPGAMGTLITAR